MRTIQLLGITAVLLMSAVAGPAVARAHPAAAFASKICPYSMTVPGGWTAKAGTARTQQDVFSKGKFVSVHVTCTAAGGRTMAQFVSQLAAGYKSAHYTVTQTKVTKDAGLVEFHTSGGLYGSETLGIWKGKALQFLYLAVLASNYKASLGDYKSMLKSVKA